MFKDIPPELLFFPEIGKVEIVRTRVEIFKIKRKKTGNLVVFAQDEMAIHEIRKRVEKFIATSKTN